ncbi:MAG: protein kinase [Anaerolineaceae bacterium]|nr:protein kinase [Anaerolineaceae bacterium]
MASAENILNQRYRLLGQLGSGGMAVIYKALDQRLARVVAVKVLRPSLTSDPGFVKRFRNEARSVARLAHPNIVTVHDVGSDRNTHFMVMEFIEGQDLKKIVRSKGLLPVDEALELAIQICAGIGFAHRSGFVHADVKSQNILMTSDNKVKVADFGIAQALSDTLPARQQQIVWGSPHYYSPEQARGLRPTPAADVYSIGVVMFEMLTGELPYAGDSPQELAQAHVNKRVPHVIDVNAAVPENISKIIHRVMQKEPTARFRTADQLGKVLASLRDHSRAYTSAAPAPRHGQGHVPAPSAAGAGAAGPPAQSAESEPAGQRPALRDGQVPTDPPRQGPRPRRDFPGDLDLVTILLALIALIAVAGLVPLLIVVLQAWNV